MPAWKKAGKLTIQCAPCLLSRLKLEIPTIVVDLRPTAEAETGHLPGAVSIPISEVSRAYDRFPKDKRAPMVLYSNDTESAIQAFEFISIWGGFTNIAVLQGGLPEWQKIGGKVETGVMATKIVYEPKPRPGEISVEEFKRIVEAKPSDKYILDVRDSEEAESGMLVGANNIATQDILRRILEIPKDKEIIIHCTTGVRAELAYLALKDAGYKTRFLNAIIKVDPNGRYEITKE